MNLDGITSSLISAEDKELIKRINQATSHIAFFGTALSINLAKALIEKKDIVQFIYIDCNELCYINGYGEVESINLLKNSGIELFEVSNVRINILVIDEEAIVYSPLPLVIEEEANKQNATGVLVPYRAVKDIIELSAPKEMAKSNENVIQMIRTNKGIVRPEEISEAKITQLEDSISNSQPIQFSITRRVNVYSNYIGFIEIQSTGLKLKSKTIRVPEELLNTSNANAEGKLKASYTLFNSELPIVKGAETLQAEIEEFRKSFSYPIKNYGCVYIKSDTKEIESRSKELENKIQSMNDSIQKEINHRFDEVIAEVTEKILPLFPSNFKNTSIAFRGADFSKEDVKREYISERIRQENRLNSQNANSLSLKVIFKDITYTMIQDEEFMEQLKQYHNLKKLFNEKGFLKESSMMELSSKNASNEE